MHGNGTRSKSFPAVAVWAVFAAVLLLLCSISLNGGLVFYSLTNEHLEEDSLQRAGELGISDGHIIGSYQEQRSAGFAVAGDGHYVVSLYLRSLYGPRYRLYSSFVVSGQDLEAVTALVEQFYVYVVRTETDPSLSHATFSLLDVKPRTGLDSPLFQMIFCAFIAVLSLFTLRKWRKKRNQDNV